MLASFTTLRRAYGMGVIFLVCCLIAWTHGLTWYVGHIPNQNTTPPDIKTDAAIVLTGGSKRIKEGLSFLENDQVNLVFISGVNKNVTVDNLYKVAGIKNTKNCCVELGRNAINTIENKREVEDWLLTHHVKSFVLITSNYHMPRSLYIFKDIQSRYTVIPYAVSPDNFELKRWWYWPNYALLVVREYNKYLLTRADDWLKAQ